MELPLNRLNVTQTITVTYELVTGGSLLVDMIQSHLERGVQQRLENAFDTEHVQVASTCERQLITSGTRTLIEPPNDVPLYSWPDVLERTDDVLTNGLVCLLYKDGYGDREDKLACALHIVTADCLECDEGCVLHGLVGTPHAHAWGWGGSNEYQVTSCVEKQLNLTPEETETLLEHLPWWVATGDPARDGFHWNIGWPEHKEED